MNITKLPSGSYRIREMVDGKSFSITVKKKPTMREAFELITEKIGDTTTPYEDLLFEDATNKYIEIKDFVLSPSTIRGYRALLRSVPNYFCEMKLKDIDQVVVQKLINDFSKDHSAKYTSNLNGLISTVFKTFMPQVHFYTTLPKKAHIEHYIPSEDDVKRIMALAEPTELYVAYCLATLGLRRSEISALTMDDLDGNVLHINKAKVLNDQEEFVIKNTTKTDASTRDIILPDDLVERIHKQGFIYNRHPNTMDNWLRRNLPHLGIRPFGVHTLRHFFASYCHQHGCTTEQIKKMGGWSSNTMEEIYRHAMDTDSAKKEMSDSIGSLFS